ncbi:MAG TPA: DUF3011 domain-containing protein [Bryobacteraceae bacterium]
MRKQIFVVLLSCGIAAAADVRTMRAHIMGGGGNDGKCTIEVNVDQVAMVEISGDQGRLITEQGQPSEWRRMDCTGPLPRNMADFRFRGVDGRGRQQLVSDPRGNRGVAVVRIEDPKGGREGYTFDIEWSGGDMRGGGDDRRDDRRDGDRRDDDRRGPRVSTVSCNSDDMRRHYCDADTRGGVRLLKQNSGSPCERDRTWGYDRRGIWVDRGCRADFEVRLP